MLNGLSSGMQHFLFKIRKQLFNFTDAMSDLLLRTFTATHAGSVVVIDVDIFPPCKYYTERANQLTTVPHTS